MMCIRFEDGWPYRPPKLFVDGIVSEHAVTDGELCLYQPGESSIASWLTFTAFQARITKWAQSQETGFRPEDAMLDAHLYFREKNGALAMIDLSALSIVEDDKAGRTGSLFARWDRDQHVLTLSQDRSSTGADIPGRWYYHGKPIQTPPRDLESFRDALTAGQRKNFDRRLKNIEKNEGPAVFTFLWDTQYGGRNALVVLVSLTEDGDMQAKALELAPTDTSILQLRAGPDVEALRDKRIVVFGVGAIGSNVACRLAEAGVGWLTLVDGDTLRPSNVVRHAASYGIGKHKTLATEMEIKVNAPWTEVKNIPMSPWSPKQLQELLADCDLAIETTGMATFAELLARVAEAMSIPLVSAALFRGGSVGRVRRQALGTDTPIAGRLDEKRYPLIPVGDEPIALEPGCSAPVNNASPVAVAAIAATTAEVVIDLLTERIRYDDEVIEVYRPLELEPFDRIGRLRG